MRIRLVCATIPFLAALAVGQETQPTGGGVGATAVTDAEIEKLIKELGNDRFPVREAASQRLRKIGLPALRALREAVKSPDPEVAARAKRLLEAILREAPALLAAQRAAVRQAFNAADYTAAMHIARQVVTYDDDASPADWLWYGHACQLAGRWADAVRVYRRTVECIDADIREGVERPPPRLLPRTRPPAVGGPPGGRAARRGPSVRRRRMPLGAMGRKNLIKQRSTLMLSIARMQSVELKDPAAAAQTLTEALEYLEASKTEVGYVWLKIAKALPHLLREAGDPAGAVAAWKRFIEALGRSKSDQRGWVADVELIHKDLCSLAKGAAWPEVPWIFPVDGEKRQITLDFDDPKTRARCYRPGLYSYYALAPPRGREFATIRFACDIEQLRVRVAGQFAAFVVADDPANTLEGLGSIGWPSLKTGRQVVRKTCAIPPGAGLVHLKIGTSKAFVVHSVSARASFRPAAKNPAPVQAGACIGTELHPSDGQITWGSLTMPSGLGRTGIRPGSGTLRFSAPGRAETVEMPFTVKSGRTYGLFFNLDSPFRWRQLQLELGGGRPRLSIQRLGEGRYIAIWCSLGRKLMAARSEDLLRWTRPEPFPLNSIFKNIEPVTFRAPDGTIHLAFISNRLAVDTTTGGFELWVTRTRDGRTWAPMRRIEGEVVGAFPPNGPCMLVGPKGRHWMFRGDRAAAAETLDGIRALTPIHVQDRKVNGRQVSMWNVHVIVDDRKRFHMVFDDFGQAIYHTSSADGRSWARPRLLLKKTGSSPGPSRPQLILAGGKALLLHDRGWLHRVDLAAEEAVVGKGIKLTSHTAPLAGSRLFRRGAEIFLVTGAQTTWLLRAKLKDLLAAPAGR